MDIKKLAAELAAIKAGGDTPHVTLTLTEKSTTFTFHDRYYYPAGIEQIAIQHQGAGVIYVYTDANTEYPHLTIPDTGTNVHWTISNGNNNSDPSTWPSPVQHFYNLFLTS